MPKEEEEDKADKGKDAKEGKGKKGKKEEKEAKPAVKQPKGPVKDDFKYMIRIADTDLDGYQTLEIALTKIKGIGRRTAIILIDKTGLPRTEKIGNLSDENINTISQALVDFPSYVPPWMVNRQQDYESGDNMHVYSTDLATFFRDDINRLKKIRCYRGVRHERGKKVRGQRTRSNGRKGLTLGVIRTKQAPAEAGSGKGGPAKTKEEKK